MDCLALITMKIRFPACAAWRHNPTSNDQREGISHSSSSSLCVDHEHPQWSGIPNGSPGCSPSPSGLCDHDHDASSPLTIGFHFKFSLHVS